MMQMKVSIADLLQAPHRVKIQALAFSPSNKYLATLGGSDDNKCITTICTSILQLNSIVIWDLEKKCALCGHEAAMQSAGEVYTLAFSKHSDNVLATGGEYVILKIF